MGRVTRGIVEEEPRSCEDVGVVAASFLLLIVSHACVNFRQFEPYMDELLHVPQAQRFCSFLQYGSSIAYDPAITTPPGLYLAPAVLSLFHPVMCSTRILRAFSAMAIFACIFQAVAVLRMLRSRNHRLGAVVARGTASCVVLGTCSILHPVVFFYANLFYTDAPGLLCVLLCMRLSLERRPWLSTTMGLASSLFRQTNAVLHGYIAFDSLVSDLFGGESAFTTVRNAAPHICAGVLYITAFVCNSFSVAVGDQEHHPLSLHFAMLPYFAVCFAPMVVPYLLSFVLKALKSATLWACYRYIAGNTELFVVAFAHILVLGCVWATGAYAHPFALADNRHYTFYIYRRVLLKPWLRYSLVPVYAFCLSLPFLSILSTYRRTEMAENKREAEPDGLAPCASRWARCEVATELGIWAAISVCVVPASLLEPRYFGPGCVLVSLRLMGRADIRAEVALFTLALLLVANATLVYVFTELPFERPRDIHMAHDASLGRFMF